MARTKLIISLFLLDQLSKFILMLYLGHSAVTNIDSPSIGLTYLKSNGFLFGIFLYIPYNRWLAVFLFAVIIWVIQLFFRFYWLKFRRNKLIYFSFTLIMAGFLGNAFDGIVLGYARDIFEIPVLVATNLSDIFILTGVFLMFIEFIEDREFLKSLPPKRNARGMMIIKSEFEKARPIVTIVKQDIHTLRKWLHLG